MLTPSMGFFCWMPLIESGAGMPAPRDRRHDIDHVVELAADGADVV